MTYITRLMKRLFPNKIITHRVSELILHSSNQNIKNNDICIAFETDNNSRQFCYLSMDELIIFYQQCPVLKRCLYELMFPTNVVKPYIDFEFYINYNLDIQNSQTGPICLLKIFSVLFTHEENIKLYSNNYMDFISKQFLILEASTSEKISYHFIYINPSVLFENNLILGLFIKVGIHFFLWLTALHKCPSFNIIVCQDKCQISDLIKLLEPHLNVLRSKCHDCHLYSTNITVSEIAHLLVLNKQQLYTLAIDLSVYNRHQQFRLFDCVKKNNSNSLVQSTTIPIKRDSSVTYYDLLKESLITYNNSSEASTIQFIDNKFIFQCTNTEKSSISHQLNLINLTTINYQLKTYFINMMTPTLVSMLTETNVTSNHTTASAIDLYQQDIQQFTSYVEKLIKCDAEHQGYIQSCIRGTRNKDLLFFNIGGNYRFCPRKRSHHQSNTIAILIDTNNHTFSIRCKDLDCQSINLVWNKIE